jgi:chromate transporter
MQPRPEKPATTTARNVPDFAEATATFARIGLISFGGPAGQIALMHRTLVDEKKWLDERRFLNALNFCMLLPGPEAMQLATYAGWRLHGVRGGLMAGLLFVVPGALLILALAVAYGLWGALPVTSAVFLGIKAAVLAIVFEAYLRIARRALKASTDWAVSTLAFIAIYFLAAPFPLIVIAALVFGYWRGDTGPEDIGDDADATRFAAAEPRTIMTVAVWLAIWIVPLLIAARYAPHTFSDIAIFFSKMAVVTFGGAYAVLAYVAQDAVAVYQWLAPGEMLDGLGLAETTPGPLILVNAFVGTLAGLRHGEALTIAGAIGGWAVTLWATFAPCFLWIFAGAPYVERLSAEPRLKSALATVTAAVTGVILNLTLWFAFNVLFRKVGTVNVGPLRIHTLDANTLSVPALVFTVLAFLLLFFFKRGVLTTLAICGGSALLWHWLSR